LPIDSLLIRINARVIGDSCAAIRGGGGAVSVRRLNRAPPTLSSASMHCCCHNESKQRTAQLACSDLSNGGHVARLHRTTPNYVRVLRQTISDWKLYCTVHSLLLLANTTVDPSMIHGSRLSCRQTRRAGRH
jgi:hypothetical protein